MITKRSYLLIPALAVMLVLNACGGGNSAANGTVTATPSTAQATNTASQAQATPAGGEAGGEAGGVEAALVTYSDAAQHFSIGHPGPWTQDTAVKNGVRFNGGDSSMTLTFAALPGGADAMSYAKGDLAAAAGEFSGFKQLGLAASTEVQGAVVLGFEASAKSAVTGKAFTARGDRYYIPLSDGRLALLTEVGPSQNYDREGVRDIALTLKSIK